MVHAKNYETMSTFVKVMQKKLWTIFPDTVYYGRHKGGIAACPLNPPLCIFRLSTLERAIPNLGLRCYTYVRCLSTDWTPLFVLFSALLVVNSDQGDASIGL